VLSVIAAVSKAFEEKKDPSMNGRSRTASCRQEKRTTILLLQEEIGGGGEGNGACLSR